jgi:hypothetical protein
MRNLKRDRCLRKADEIVDGAKRYVRNGGYDDLARGEMSTLLNAMAELAALPRSILTRPELKDFERKIWSEIERVHEARKLRPTQENVISIHEYEEIKRRWGIGHVNRPRMTLRPQRLHSE